MCKMNVRLFTFALILCLVFLLTGPRDTYGYLWPKQNTYMTRWDKVNLNEILDSKRLLQYYFNCLMSKGPCPPDGMELKREFFLFGKKFSLQKNVILQFFEKCSVFSKLDFIFFNFLLFLLFTDF